MDHVFVYGTLKRQQCRGNAWPRTPVEVRAAFTSGELYDLGAYPAMTAGEDDVSGELWTFRSEDMPATLDVLDEIEGVSAGLYERVRVECWFADAAQAPRISAYTYHYRQSLGSAKKLQPQGFSIWPPQ